MVINCQSFTLWSTQTVCWKKTKKQDSLCFKPWHTGSFLCWELAALSKTWCPHMSQWRHETLRTMFSHYFLLCLLKYHVGATGVGDTSLSYFGEKILYSLSWNLRNSIHLKYVYHDCIICTTGKNSPSSYCLVLTWPYTLLSINRLD